MPKKPKPLRLPEPKNSNVRLPPQHTLYVATTGGGKTTAVKKLDTVPKGAQVVFFDPYRNYAGKKFKGQTVQAFTEFAPFARAVLAARKKKIGFKIALVKDANMQNLETFAAIVWSLGDGNKPALHVVIEELASAVETAGKLKGKAGELWRGGRQFGLVMHSLFQRMQEVPKTVVSQSVNWWVGGLASSSDAEYISKAKGHDIREISALKTAQHNKGIAQYLLFGNGIGNVKQGELNCKS
jgi:DNA helicase HerA-like ATPase